MVDLSSFHHIIIENISFINTFNCCGIKIHDGDASRVFMNSINFRNINLETYIFYFDSLDSTLIINDLKFVTLSFKKSNQNNRLIN